VKKIYEFQHVASKSEEYSRRDLAMFSLAQVALQTLSNIFVFNMSLKVLRSFANRLSKSSQLKECWCWSISATALMLSVVHMVAHCQIFVILVDNRG